MSMDHFMGYLASWSPYAAYRATHPDRPDPLVELRAQLKCEGGGGGGRGGAGTLKRSINPPIHPSIDQS